MSGFNSSRLVLARQRRRLTKKALAEAAGLDPKSVQRYEAGDGNDPSPATLEAIARALNYPIEFFTGHELYCPQPDAVSFRALSMISARDRDAAIAAAALATQVMDWVEEHFELSPVDMPDYREGRNPEVAARALRERWGLGEAPVRNMVHLLESKGVKVFSLRENAHAVDAFSLWRRDVPYAFLNTFKTPERSRFDAAHELGHLVLHRHAGTQGEKAAEADADAFASAFLMPADDVRARLPRVLSLDDVIEAKLRWRVSAMALIYRLNKLQLITPWQYRTLCIQLNERYGRKEPNGIEREVSFVWDKVTNSLKHLGLNKHRLAAKLALPVQELESLWFQLTPIQGLEGGASFHGKSQAKLSLVPSS